METLPQDIYQHILHYLKFSHLWNLSLVNQYFRSIVSVPGVIDKVFEERWGSKPQGATLNQFLEKARNSYVRLLGSDICCSRWKLEPDYRPSLSSSSSSSSNKREVQYDDFDEEILPESDDFGDDDRGGKSVFEDDDFVDYNTKIKNESVFVTFETDAQIQLHLIFVESYLTCEPVLKILIGYNDVRIWVDGVIVKQVTKQQNPHARLNESGYQKFWALITGSKVKFGRGELATDCVIEWEGEFEMPSHIGLSAPNTPVLVRNIETSAAKYLDVGIDDSESEIALKQGEKQITSTNWHCNTSAIIQFSAYWDLDPVPFTITLSGVDGIVSYRVVVSPTCVMMKPSISNKKSVRFSSLGSRFGTYWITIKGNLIRVGSGRQIGKNQIGEEQCEEYIKIGQVRINIEGTGEALNKISNFIVLYNQEC